MLTFSFIFLTEHLLCKRTTVDDAWKREGHKKDFNILRGQSFSFRLWWLADIVKKCAWVEVPALTIVRYINYAVIIPLRLLGSHCSCQDAAPYKCTGLPRVPSNSKQMSQNTALSISQDRWESLFNQCYCKSGVLVNYSILRQAYREYLLSSHTAVFSEGIRVMLLSKSNLTQD